MNVRINCVEKIDNEKQITDTYNLIYGKLFNHETKYLKYRKKIIKKNFFFTKILYFMPNYTSQKKT